MSGVRIAVDDPRRDEVRRLLAWHLEFAHANSPPQDVHALDVEGLLDPSLTFFSGRDDDGHVVVVGALKELDAQHGELKSMHTAVEARGRGLGRAMLQHLLDVAAERGYRRVSLETGTPDAFVAARTLYESAGFAPCEPFADYFDSPNSVCMTRTLP